MIKVIDLDTDNKEFSPSVIGLGNFDGVHIGHRTIMNKVIDEANRRGIDSSILLFKQHTNEVFPKMPPYYISSLQDKIDILDDLGIDKVFIIDFTMEFAQLTNDEFILDFIKDRLNASVLVSGEDYTYGKKSLGTVKELRQYEAQGLIEVYTVDDFFYKGDLISSTIVRELISDGDFQEVTQILNMPYTIRANVVHGYKRGKKLLGFPTANLQLDFSYIMPGEALYLTNVILDGKKYPSMTSVGTNPTFTDEKTIKIETYIIDFDQNLYGENIRLEFLKKMRDQIKFNSPDELIEQMESDEKEARLYFNI